LIDVIDEPPQPDRWKGMSPYQRINLSQFVKLDPLVRIKDFFNRYESQLRSILLASKEGQFYVEYGRKNELRISERYIAKAPLELYHIFNDFSNYLNFHVIFVHGSTQILTKNEPPYPDYSPPGRISTVTNRIIRDTQLVRDMKKEFHWRCQICNKTIILPEDKSYSEGHHLQPLGGEYTGPDIRENIIILCPFHHAEFDYSSIAIHPETKKILHADSNNEFYDRDLAYKRDNLGKEFLEFHYKNIYWGR
jgi:hypothetical protein